eukprot:INCI15718.1.p1 GENE.INCI15718.1~~INCI15718.1.p1  ORF type:complete len:605 (-),score=106.35 INCI15718.1:542-2218(-)
MEGDSCFVVDVDERITCTICDVVVKSKKNAQAAMKKHLSDKTHKKIAKKTGSSAWAHTKAGGGAEEETLVQKMANLALKPSSSKTKKKKTKKKGARAAAGAGGGSVFASRLTNEYLVGLAKFVPVRLDSEERRLLRLVEGALDISEYTDRVDIAGNMMGYSSYFGSRAHAGNKSGVIIDQLREILRLLTGLELATNFKHGRELGQGLIADDSAFYSHMFEVARRYKVQNPEKLRSTYGKMMFALMDASLPKVRNYLGCKLYKPIQCVPDLVATYGSAGAELLCDAELLEATRPLIFSSIVPTPKPVANSATSGVESVPKPARPVLDEDGDSASEGDISQGADSEDVEEGTVSSMTAARAKKDAATASIVARYSARKIPPEVISRCLGSLNDALSSVVANAEPVERLLQLLVRRFSPSDPEMGGVGSLAIYHGRGGSRLSHSHDTQFFFVMQTLCLWRRVMQNLLHLWHAADHDLASGAQDHALRNTGQGMNRVQRAPQVSREMSHILSCVKQEVQDWREATGHENTAKGRLGGRGWVGLSVVHLGDRDVPNALVFIDK